MISKNIKNKIKEYFYINPTIRLRVRQIERNAGTALPSAIRYAKELEKENILKSVSIAGVKLYTTDRTSESYLLEKKQFNIKELFNSGLIDYIKHEYNNPNIVVFGSFMRGEDTEKSDIDLYIEYNGKIKGLKKFEKRLKRNIQLFCFKNIKQIKNKELANNIINGITLNGFVEVFKWKKAHGRIVLNQIVP